MEYSSSVRLPQLYALLLHCVSERISLPLVASPTISHYYWKIIAFSLWNVKEGILSPWLSGSRKAAAIFLILTNVVFSVAHSLAPAVVVGPSCILIPVPRIMDLFPSLSPSCNEFYSGLTGESMRCSFHCVLGFCFAYIIGTRIWVELCAFIIEVTVPFFKPSAKAKPSQESW